MKRKLLVLSFAITSLFCSAQKTFVEKYRMYVTNVNNEISEPKNAETTIVFNEGGTTDIVIYLSDAPKRFFRTGDITKGKSNGGYDYQVVNCIDSESGKEVQIQLFDDACRVFFGLDYIEYDK